jgi:hypothetical protein
MSYILHRNPFLMLKKNEKIIKTGIMASLIVFAAVMSLAVVMSSNGGEKLCQQS